MSDLMGDGVIDPVEEDDEQEEQEVSEQFADLLALDNSTLIGMLVNPMVDNDRAAACLAVIQNRIKDTIPAARKALKEATNAYPKNEAITEARKAFDAAATALPEYAELKALLEERMVTLSALETTVQIETGYRTILDTMLPTIRKQRGDDNFGSFVRARRTTSVAK